MKKIKIKDIFRDVADTNACLDVEEESYKTIAAKTKRKNKFALNRRKTDDIMLKRIEIEEIQFLN